MYIFSMYQYLKLPTFKLLFVQSGMWTYRLTISSKLFWSYILISNWIFQYIQFCFIFIAGFKLLTRYIFTDYNCNLIKFISNDYASGGFLKWIINNTN